MSSHMMNSHMSTYCNPQIRLMSLVGTDAKPGVFSRPEFAGSVDEMGGTMPSPWALGRQARAADTSTSRPLLDGVNVGMKDGMLRGIPVDPAKGGDKGGVSWILPSF